VAHDLRGVAVVGAAVAVAVGVGVGVADAPGSGAIAEYAGGACCGTQPSAPTSQLQTVATTTANATALIRVTGCSRCARDQSLVGAMTVPANTSAPGQNKIFVLRPGYGSETPATLCHGLGPPATQTSTSLVITTAAWAGSWIRTLPPWTTRR
jgi:hypothetical protein